ncbi:uncharacterized protein IWZ02DRAFT_459019, partial [Phyllosticta citriasiana]|uniref:uncharacterized protein n=1 Tax=Phyllosticta citriasiana TaxID=595635 RepID=UPI0030FD4B6C
MPLCTVLLAGSVRTLLSCPILSCLFPSSSAFTLSACLATSWSNAQLYVLHKISNRSLVLPSIHPPIHHFHPHIPPFSLPVDQTEPTQTEP